MVRVNEENPDTFAGRLRLAMDRESVNSFAQRAGVPEASIRAYMRGTVPGLDKAMALAQAGRVSLEWLAFGRGPMRTEFSDPDNSDMDDPMPEGFDSPPVTVSAAKLPLLPIGNPERRLSSEADEDLMSKIGELVANVHREMGVSLPPSQLFRLAARKHNEVMAARPGEGELPVMLKLLETQLRAELKEARSEPGTGKRLA